MRPLALGESCYCYICKPNAQRKAFLAWIDAHWQERDSLAIATAEWLDTP